MTALLWILRLPVQIFFFLLIGRLVLDWIQILAREWRPRGPVLVLAEVIYTITDPPLKLIRRAVPPLRIGSIQLDLAFLILLLLCSVLLRLLS